jgi:hypothetical protein
MKEMKGIKGHEGGSARANLFVVLLVPCAPAGITDEG